MASEIEAATERKRRHAMTEAGSDEWFDYARQECGNSQEDRDNATLADAYVARLAADRAEREERARPIDAEWLESIGFANAGAWMSINVGPVELTWDRVSGLWVDVARPLSAVKTRGQLLDLLRVLKGGAE